LQDPPLSVKSREAIAKDFRSRDQLQKLLWKGFLLWLRTLLVLFLLGMTLCGFHKKPVMSKGEKEWFNMIMTALKVALGLNIAAALNDMANNMRWYFLSRAPRSLAEVRQRLNSDGATC